LFVPFFGDETAGTCDLILRPERCLCLSPADIRALCACTRDPCRCVSLKDRFFTPKTRQILLLICSFGFSQLHAAIGDEQPARLLSHARSMTACTHARLAAASRPLLGGRTALMSLSVLAPCTNPHWTGGLSTRSHATWTSNYCRARLLKMRLRLDDGADHMVPLDISNRLVPPSSRYNVANTNLDH
jgi:hypothetical protein